MQMREVQLATKGIQYQCIQQRDHIDFGLIGNFKASDLYVKLVQNLSNFVEL